MNPSAEAEWRFGSAEAPYSSDYVTPRVVALCRAAGARRVLDLGCGNGVLCDELKRAGFDVMGCDPSVSGIREAQAAFPGIRFQTLSVDDPPESLAGGPFDAVVATEVIEHLYLPRHLPRFARAVLRPGGSLIVSTPYHGYWKNLLLALSGKWDFHHHPWLDGGHVKFWSRATLSALLAEEGFVVNEFHGAGRFAPIWRSMILVARKPGKHDASGDDEAV